MKLDELIADLAELRDNMRRMGLSTDVDVRSIGEGLIEATRYDEETKTVEVLS